MRESEFQARLIGRIESLFPGCLILKNDSGYMQGIPDLAIFYGERWAMLEVKASERARHQPNQDYYIQLLDSMSFAAFINPSNEEDVLDALQQALAPRRNTRLSRR